MFKENQKYFYKIHLPYLAFMIFPPISQYRLLKAKFLEILVKIIRNPRHKIVKGP